MKRSILIAALLALLSLLVLATSSASAQSKPRAAPRKPAATKPPAGDVPKSTEGYLWRHYGGNPQVPDEDIPTPQGVDTAESTQIHNIIFKSAGYEKANERIREGLAGVFFGDWHYTLPDSFWMNVERQFENGTVEEFCIADGEKAGDYPLAFGSKKDANGFTRHYVETPYAINKTGGPVCGYRLKQAILLTEGPNKGDWVHPVIYKKCRNETGFKGTAPPVTTEAPLPPTITPESITRAAEAAAVTLPPVTVGVERHRSHKGLIAGLLIGAAATTVVCLATREHNRAAGSAPKPPQTPIKVPPPPVIRP